MIGDDEKLFYDLINSETLLWELIDKDIFLKVYKEKTISEPALFSVLSIQALLA